MKTTLLVLVLVILWTSPAHGGIKWFLDAPHKWQAASGTHTTIDFTEFPVGTFITDQYKDVGLTFTNVVFIHNAESYSDGFGLAGNDGVRFALDTPHHSVAVDFLGSVAFALYSAGDLIATVEWFAALGGAPRFVGITSEFAFDEVYLYKPQPPHSNNAISIDTLYWGAPVPAPGVVGVLGLAALGTRRRKRMP